MERHKVAIIGAGLAGLTAALRLKQQGIDVHVYEARDRVGGRIFSANISGKVAEIGGANIADGGNSDNIALLIKELHLELQKKSLPLQNFYFSKGKLFSINEWIKEKAFTPDKLKRQLEDLAKNSENMQQVLQGVIEKNHPLYTALAVRLSGYEGAPVEKLSPCYFETLYYMLLGGIAAAHNKNEEEVENPSIHLSSIKGGNSLLVDKMARLLSEKLHLKCALSDVTKDTEGTYVLSFKNQRRVKAQILVLAIPCSVFSDINFDNQTLPQERKDAISRVQYGTNAKLLIPSLIEVPSYFFINDYVGCYLDQERSLFTLYYTGEESKFSQDTVQEIYRRDKKIVEKGFQVNLPYNSATYAKDESLASYEEPVGYSWPLDPFVKGSYSYIAAGQEELLCKVEITDDEKVKRLFSPIGGKLFFAGEHTSILFEVAGTMEAACESGERAARMIMKAIPK